MDTSERYRRLAAEPFLTVDSSGMRTSSRGGKIREILSRRELLNLLVRRDLQARYRDSFLGFLWTVIRPIIQFLMYFIVLGQFLRAAEGIDQFAIYLFSGLTLFTLLQRHGLRVDGFDHRQRRPGEEDLPAARDLPARQHRRRGLHVPRPVGACCCRPRWCSRRCPSPIMMLWFFPSMFLILVYGIGIGLLLCGSQRLPARYPVPHRGRDDAGDVGFSHRLLLADGRRRRCATFGLPAWVLEIYAANPITLAVLGFHKAFWGAGTPRTTRPTSGCGC